MMIGMPIWLQHVFVGLIVAACVAAVIAGAVRTFWGKRSRVGSCCSKGCGDSARPADSAAAPSPERIAFLPADVLRLRVRSQRR